MLKKKKNKFGRPTSRVLPLQFVSKSTILSTFFMNGYMPGTTPHSGGDRRAYYLRLIAAASSLFHLRQILSHAIISGHHPDLPTTTKLIHRHSDLSKPPSSALPLALFNSHPQPDLFLLNVLLRSLPAASALSLFSNLPQRHPHLRPDSFTFSFALSAAASLSSPSTGRALHGQIILAGGLDTDRFIGSALTDFYFKFMQISNAEKVFDQIPHPDTVSWNSRISGLVRCCSFLRAVRAFGRMVALGNCVDSTTLAVVLPATAELQDLILGRSMHCLGLKTGMEDQPHVVTGLLSLYSKCDDIPAAEIIFEEIDQPDIIHCNVMISGYSSTGCIRSSVDLFRDLQFSGWRPNSSTLVALIPVTDPFGHECLCREIHGFLVKTRLDLDLLVSTALTTVYSKLNDIESARKVFDAMSEKSLASWNAMISGYAQNGLTEFAISLFQDMQSLNFKPNPVTAASILSACAQLGALTLGKWIHQIIIHEDLELNVYVCTALIDMYAKCGNIVEAQRIFNGMAEKNVVSWNAMISGYGLHGYGHEALRLFSEMLSAQISPTSTTFLSVLHACSHGGLVEEGHDIFLSMARNYGVCPRAEHYACMVDLLGRAGRLIEALDFIRTAPKDVGPGVWGAFLGACKVHKVTSLAKLASKKLFELEPENAGYYVLLSNIYSASHNFLEAAAVREAAKRKNLAKLPGCTIIEVNDVVHSFTAGDRSHPQTLAIYSMLESLLGKIVEAGYQAETQAVLYDVEEEEKEQMIKIHSEKLAIAFGLINAKSESEIRIIKNLRVCLDCHNWTKFISVVTKRVIVVRDASRFHHFRDGMCSCRDYW
ncbi:pentatricopeptide repeat-containing protein At4g30700 isoform X1 [Dendrobium catenatum]|nr:pentatricopeptide repeat-containing protein At4g30700 isoform X1 [Dendrobium catenatum]XP_028547998.1 pentatricopeptide repeat-containing protein At4g30700 isoform X1 [Dendrobium catenatum]